MPRRLAIIALTGGTGRWEERVEALAPNGVDMRCIECVHVGWVGVLVGALERHSRAPSVVERACLALRNLTSTTQGERGERG